jgi:hypothetical protein
MPIYIDLCTEAAQRTAACGAWNNPAPMTRCPLPIIGNRGGIAGLARISLVA